MVDGLRGVSITPIFQGVLPLQGRARNISEELIRRLRRGSQLKDALYVVSLCDFIVHRDLPAVSDG